MFMVLLEDICLLICIKINHFHVVLLNMNPIDG